VDYLREVAPGSQGGAYLRVTPRRGGGSGITMTLPLSPDVEAGVVADTLRQELAELVELLAADD